MTKQWWTQIIDPTQHAHTVLKRLCYKDEFNLVEKKEEYFKPEWDEENKHKTLRKEFAL